MSVFGEGNNVVMEKKIQQQNNGCREEITSIP